MGQCTYFKNPSKYFKMLMDDKTEVSHINLVNPEMVEVHWKYCDGFLTPSRNSNVIIALYTTSHARIKLLKAMEKLHPSQMLYVDTDSIMYISRPNLPMLPDSCFLGELSDALSGRKIHIYGSAGPKNYGYKCFPKVNNVDVKKSNNITSEEEENDDDDHGEKGSDVDGTCCKIKGITLSFRNTEKINFKTIVSLVTQCRDEQISVCDPQFITRDQTDRQIVTKSVSKTYCFVYDKRVIISDYETRPYGY